MEVSKNVSGNGATITVEGRIDTNTAPLLENEITNIENYDRVVFDFAKLDYISSAGLRVLLMAQKRMNSTKGKMIIRNVSDNIKEVFEMTGFTDIIEII